MGPKTAAVKAKDKNVPTATLVKRAERKTPGRPSEERQQRVQDRLKRSPFGGEDD